MTRPNEPGLYPGVSFEEYLAWDAVSSHDLMLVRRSPAHLRDAKAAPRQPTDAMRMGTAAHAWILQPEEAPDLVMVAPKVDRRTKAGKQMWAEFLEEAGDRTIVNEEEATALAKMAGAVAAAPAAQAVLGAAKVREASMLWRSWIGAEPSDVWSRGRPDAVSECGGLIVDLKTTQDASPDAFARTAANFNYPLQAAYYIDGLKAAGIASPEAVISFVFLVVEKTPPYGVAVYTLPEEAIELGRSQYQSAFSTYEDAVATNIWGGYSAAYQIETLNLPRWAFRTDD